MPRVATELTYRDISGYRNEAQRPVGRAGCNVSLWASMMGARRDRTNRAVIFDWLPEQASCQDHDDRSQHRINTADPGDLSPEYRPLGAIGN